MRTVERLLYAAGGLGALAALAWVVLDHGWGLGNAVAGVLSCAAVAAGALLRALGPPTADPPASARGDDIAQEHIRTDGAVTGKSGPARSSRDRVRQRRIRAGGDVIGKQDTPPPASGTAP